MFKKLIVLIALFVGLAGTTVHTASAATTSPKIYIDGSLLSLSNQPILRNGATLIPLRQVAEKLGLSVIYDAKTNVITFKHPYRSTNATHKIGTNRVVVGNKSQTFNANSVVINGVTYVPIRLFQSFDAKVFWDSKTNSVYVYSYEYRQNQLVMFASMAYDDLEKYKQGTELKNVNFNNLKKTNGSFKNVQKYLYIYNKDSKGDISTDRFAKEYAGMKEWKLLSYLTRADFKSDSEYKSMQNSGFRGYAFQNVITKEVVIAYRGTDNQPDAMTDLNIFYKRYDNQKIYAHKLYENVINKCNGPTIYLVGHSLGGNLVQASAIWHPTYYTKGYTYNALGSGVRNSTSKVVNYRIVGDLVSASRYHYGREQFYNVRAYPDNFKFSAHKVFNFYGYFYPSSTKYFGSLAIPFNQGKPNYEWTY
ncbi:stalk domain-containing protein [Priestia aryabhattai]